MKTLKSAAQSSSESLQKEKRAPSAKVSIIPFATDAPVVGTAISTRQGCAGQRDGCVNDRDQNQDVLAAAPIGRSSQSENGNADLLRNCAATTDMYYDVEQAEEHNILPVRSRRIWPICASESDLADRLG